MNTKVEDLRSELFIIITTTAAAATTTRPTTPCLKKRAKFGKL